LLGVLIGAAFTLAGAVLWAASTRGFAIADRCVFFAWLALFGVACVLRDFINL